MNREILFRGKRIDGTGWVEGYIVKLGSFWRISCDIHRWAVFPETVGQFTGLTDKNGVKIFEGDFIQAESFDKQMLVIWRKDFASFALSADGWMYGHYFGEVADPGHCTVTGNIHDK